MDEEAQAKGDDPEVMDEKAGAVIRFDYKVSPNYAVFATTGVHGGPNAQGDIVMNFFNERAPIPKHQSYRVRTDGTLEDQPFDQELKPGVIRDVFVGILISPATARAMAKWLLHHADTLEQVRASLDDTKGPPDGEEKHKPH